MYKFNGVSKLKGFIQASALMLLAVLVSSQAIADIVIDGQVIPSDDINSININPSNGRIGISTTGYTVIKDDAAPGGLVVTFSASATDINEGDSITLSWSTQNATSCNASNSWSGSLALPSGTSSSITLNTAGSYTFSINCTGTSGDSKSRSVTVTVADPAVIPTTCTAPPLSGNIVQWDTVWGDDFPIPFVGDKIMDVSRSGYTAVEFNTANFYGVGGFKLIQTTTTPGLKLGAISECPGDFNVDSRCDHVWGIDQTIIWGTINNASTCQLKPNTTYYFNITFTDGAQPATTTCVSRNCVVRWQSTSRDLQ